ncbi:UNVERIFIED_CONTAM: hypothetical protein K2H54_042055 [Gekko kuhli]
MKPFHASTSCPPPHTQIHIFSPGPLCLEIVFGCARRTDWFLNFPKVPPPRFCQLQMPPAVPTPFRRRCKTVVVQEPRQALSFPINSCLMFFFFAKKKKD